MNQQTLKNCPVCKKPATESFRPFCSKRCADIDLGSWLGERYKVPTNEGPDTSNHNDDADIE
ncbi:MAG: DNA gyrase inhibitor YacG [Alphaproteobacteria bacterium]